MGNPVYQTITTTGTATAVCLDWTITPPNTAFSVGFNGTSSATYSVEYTLDDLQTTTGTWFDTTIAAGTTASLSGNITFPVTYLRVNCTAITGSMQFSVLQGFPA